MRGLLIMLALIAAVAGGGYGLRTYAPQYLPNQWTTDDVLRERTRDQIAQDPRSAEFFAKFETLFPADYNEVMNQLIALQRRGGTNEEANRWGEAYMRSFMNTNRAHVVAAEPAALRAVAEAFADGTRRLRQENVALCAQTFRDGRGFTTPEQGLSPETQAAFFHITDVMLDAIASGKRAPQQYQEPTEAQWNAMFARYQALGGDPRSLGVNPNALPPDRVCALAEHLWTAVAQGDDDFTARFVSYSLRER